MPTHSGVIGHLSTRDRDAVSIGMPDYQVGAAPAAAARLTRLGSTRHRQHHGDHQKPCGQSRHGEVHVVQRASCCCQRPAPRRRQRRTHQVARSMRCPLAESGEMSEKRAPSSASDTQTAHSFCRACVNSCPTLVDVADGRLTRVKGDPDNAVFQGYACIKGMSQAALHNHPDRLLHSLKRQPVADAMIINPKVCPLRVTVGCVRELFSGYHVHAALVNDDRRLRTSQHRRPPGARKDRRPHWFANDATTEGVPTSLAGPP
jgi:hypothetical protein